MSKYILYTLLVLVGLTGGFLYFHYRPTSGTSASGSTSDTNPLSVTTATPMDLTTPTPALTDPADVATAHKVILKTSKGDITIDLFPDDAPHTVKNFVTLGKRGYYQDVLFHRVIKDFMIQTGDPKGDGTGGESIYGSTFPDEINSHKIVKGSVAMANRGANTNGSQFFIVTESDQPSLDGHYTCFGQAEDASMPVVQAIAAVPTDSNDRPTQDIRITGFQIITP